MPDGFHITATYQKDHETASYVFVECEKEKLETYIEIINEDKTVKSAWYSFTINGQVERMLPTLIIK